MLHFLEQFLALLTDQGERKMTFGKCGIAIYFIFGVYSHFALAEPVFFPDPTPNAKSDKKPDWMKLAEGDDGYVRVTAEVRLPSDSSCIPLGQKSVFRDTNVQLVLSITTFGFGNPQEKKEIPFATFDSRGMPGECISPVRLPIPVVPLTRLEERPAENPGEMKILLNVRSTTSTSSKLVEKAGAALNAVALVATGGASSTVAGLSAKLTNTAVAPLVSEFEKYASNITTGTGIIDLDWRSIRSTPQSYVFRIFEADAEMGSSAADTIRDKQKQGSESLASRFEVRFTFSYVRTIFDSNPYGNEYLPRGDHIQRKLVLDHPADSVIPNLLQTLNSNSPSPLGMVSTGPSLTSVCNEISGKLLRQLGLNAIDRVVVLKSFIDEAFKGTSWLYTNDFNFCFQDQESARKLAAKIYKIPEKVVAFDVADMQRDEYPDFKPWKTEVEGSLADFRRAMISDGPKAPLLLNISGGSDINVDIRPKNFPWPDTSSEKPLVSETIKTNESTGFDVGKYPGIARLATKTLKLGGCFVWAFDEDKNIGAGAQPKAHMLFAGNKDIWLASITLSQSKPRRISEVKLFEIDSSDSDWIFLFKNRKFGANAQCDKIIPMLPT